MDKILNISKSSD